MSEPAEVAEPPAVLQPQHLQGGGDHHPLLFVIRGRDSLEGLQALQGELPALGLVRNHAADTPSQNRTMLGEKLENANS